MHFFDKFWLWAPAPALGDGLADDFVVLFVSSLLCALRLYLPTRILKREFHSLSIFASVILFCWYDHRQKSSSISQSTMRHNVMATCNTTLPFMLRLCPVVLSKTDGSYSGCALSAILAAYCFISISTRVVKKRPARNVQRIQDSSPFILIRLAIR
jgi:hypothetical protein